MAFFNSNIFNSYKIGVFWFSKGSLNGVRCVCVYVREIFKSHCNTHINNLTLKIPTKPANKELKSKYENVAVPSWGTAVYFGLIYNIQNFGPIPNSCLFENLFKV